MAKRITLGIIYGLGCRNLARQTGLTEHDAQMFLDRFFAEFKEVKRLMHQTMIEMVRSGEVRNHFGRIRRIVDHENWDPRHPTRSQRQAFNQRDSIYPWWWNAARDEPGPRQ